MNFAVDDTIVAVASAPGGAWRGVIRLSGPATLACLSTCFRASTSRALETLRRPTHIPGVLDIPAPIGELPCHLYVWPTCRSYTRQPSAELHTLGSPPLLDAALEVLCHCGARLAQPGEFTLRAFLAGRLDLTQAEAVLGVIDAENARELQVALAQLAGGLSGPLMDLRGRLLDLLARLEAGLDFADEDIDFVSRPEIGAELALALKTIGDVLTQLTARGEVSADARVVLHGRPNVGKSSLLNALVGTNAAIVSPQAGTTRDYVARPFCWQDVPGILFDTPGYVDEPTPVTLAHAAQQAAAALAREARLRIFCLDATRPLLPGERDLLEDDRSGRRLVVWTKADLDAARRTDVPGAIRTSSRSGEGLEELRIAIVRHLREDRAEAQAAMASTALRCRQSLDLAAARLDRAHQILAEDGGEELIALELRDALDNLGQIVGAVYTDDILERIFSRFCIGK